MTVLPGENRTHPLLCEISPEIERLFNEILEMTNQGLTWVVVKTKPRQEQRAKENLDRQGYSTYLPRLSVKKRLRGVWQMVSEPLFPGYIFLGFELDKVSLAPVRSTLGVLDLVRFGQSVLPVPGDVIDYMRLREKDANQLVVDNLPFSVGDRVDILEGPFVGLPAVYQMAKGEERAVVMISLLGRENTVCVPFDHIIPAN